MCEYLLNAAGVATVPGETFEAPGFIRLAYCSPIDYLAGAMESMGKALKKL